MSAAIERVFYELLDCGHAIYIHTFVGQLPASQTITEGQSLCLPCREDKGLDQAIRQVVECRELTAGEKAQYDVGGDPLGVGLS